MFSRMDGRSPVRLLRRSASQPRLWYIALALTAVLAFGLNRISSGQGNNSPASTVSAASFEDTPVAPNSIVSAFGARLATQTAAAVDVDPNTPGIQLPENLGGTTVEVNGLRAGLLFVSPEQVNYVIPSATQTGAATVTVSAGDGTISSGTVEVSTVAPAIFTANANGSGVAAAGILRVKIDGSQSNEPVAQFDQTAGRFLTKPIDLGPAGERVFLILFLSGIGQAQDPNGDGNLNENVKVLIDTDELTPAFAGRQSQFAGLDQINVELPRTLIGRGKINITVNAPGFTASNPVEIEIAGPAGPAPPQINGFSASPTLAGQTIQINGGGFALDPADNAVRITGLDTRVSAATASALTVTVPYGAETGSVSVRTPQGEGVSSSSLAVRTSISGVVEDTARQAMAGMSVRVTDTEISAVTSSDGGFVLPDVPPGPHFVEIDGGSILTDPPYPTVTVKITAQSNRDNQFTHPISLQQQTGSSAVIGSTGSSTGVSQNNTTAKGRLALTNPAITIQTGDFILTFPEDVSAIFPNGDTRGAVTLTPLFQARTPVPLPRGFHSSSIVQITPFNVQIAEGGTLTFPNSEGLAPGTQATLFRYDPLAGRFVKDLAKAFVSDDGLRVVTEPGAIKITSYYFVAVQRPTTTLVGRVLQSNGQPSLPGSLAQSDGLVPVPRVNALFRGQEAITDSNGSYVLRDVPIGFDESVSVEINYLRPSGRVERVFSQSVPALPDRTTKIPDVVLPGEDQNRAPVILAPPRLDIPESQTSDFRIQVKDPDVGQTVEVRVDGASFASIVGGTATPNSYILRLAPGVSSAGQYRLIVTATDNLGASATQEIALTVRDVNLPPVARDQFISVEEGSSVTFTLNASDPEGGALIYTIVRQPRSGALSGSAPLLQYTPEPRFSGNDEFTYRVSDGVSTSDIAKVTIRVTGINHPPQLDLIGVQEEYSEGQEVKFIFSGTDPDQTQTLTLTPFKAFPSGSTFTPLSPGKAEFAWTPDFDFPGDYVLAATVTDNGTPRLSDSNGIIFTIPNTEPTLSDPGTQTVNAGQTVSFTLTATDRNTTQTLTFDTVNTLPGGTLTKQTATTADFLWTNVPEGTYNITFRVTDDGTPNASDSTAVQIVATDSGLNFRPELYAANGVTEVSGDLNGDGLEDRVVGVPAKSDGLNRGAVYVYFKRRTIGPIEAAR
ncbi:MAG TPA: Ig-like domain-containing protein, partial [Blastocatellia bacterium]|nr:Ig-like domain-containing protein [Blastocatellia bacterium]